MQIQSRQHQPGFGMQIVPAKSVEEAMAKSPLLTKTIKTLQKSASGVYKDYELELHILPLNTPNGQIKKTVFAYLTDLSKNKVFPQKIMSNITGKNSSVFSKKNLTKRIETIYEKALKLCCSHEQINESVASIKDAHRKMKEQTEQVPADFIKNERRKIKEILGKIKEILA